MPTQTAASPTGSAVSPYTSTTSVSPFASGYATDMLSTAQALADKPYQQYGGQLVAGYGAGTGIGNALSGIGALTLPTGIGTAETNTGNLANASFTALGTAQQYMNPYLQASLNPQLDEARRQSGITQMENAAKMAKAGAYGGSRQAIMDTETQRNLGVNLANITAQGYSTAYDKAMAQYNAEQQQKLSAEQQRANLAQMGLSAQEGILDKQLSAGQTQRGLEQETLSSAYNQWKEGQQYPYEQLKFQSEMLSGLPITSQQVTTPDKTAFEKLAAGLGGVNNFMTALGQSGLVKDASGKPISNIGDLAKWLKGKGIFGGASDTGNAVVGTGADAGWTFYPDSGVSIGPDGTYYGSTGNIIWSPTVNYGESEIVGSGADAGWAFYPDSGVSISPDGVYYDDAGGVIWSPSYNVDSAYNDAGY